MDHGAQIFFVSCENLFFKFLLGGVDLKPLEPIWNPPVVGVPESLLTFSNTERKKEDNCKSHLN